MSYWPSLSWIQTVGLQLASSLHQVLQSSESVNSNSFTPNFSSREHLGQPGQVLPAGLFTTVLVSKRLKVREMQYFTKT